MNERRNESLAQIVGIGERRGLDVNLEAAELTFNQPYTVLPAQTGDPNEVMIVQSLIVAGLPAIGWILSPTELRAVKSHSVADTYISAFKAAAHVGLVVHDDQGWRTNQVKINSLIAVYQKIGTSAKKFGDP